LEEVFKTMSHYLQDAISAALDRAETETSIWPGRPPAAEAVGHALASAIGVIIDHFNADAFVRGLPGLQLRERTALSSRPPFFEVSLEGAGQLTVAVSGDGSRLIVGVLRQGLEVAGWLRQFERPVSVETAPETVSTLLGYWLQPPDHELDPPFEDDEDDAAGAAEETTR
jgi:hypothetical protein